MAGTSAKRKTKNRRAYARLTAGGYDMAAEVSAVTGQTISQVLEQSIMSYHQSVLANRHRPWLLLRKTGLIGIGRADRNLSESYKSALTESLAKKRVRK